MKLSGGLIILIFLIAPSFGAVLDDFISRPIPLDEQVIVLYENLSLLGNDTTVSEEFALLAQAAQEREEEFVIDRYIASMHQQVLAHENKSTFVVLTNGTEVVLDVDQMIALLQTGRLITPFIFNEEIISGVEALFLHDYPQYCFRLFAHLHKNLFANDINQFCTALLSASFLSMQVGSSEKNYSRSIYADFSSRAIHNNFNNLEVQLLFEKLFIQPSSCSFNPLSLSFYRLPLLLGTDGDLIGSNLESSPLQFAPPSYLFFEKLSPLQDPLLVADGYAKSYLPHEIQSRAEIELVASHKKTKRTFSYFSSSVAQLAEQVVPEDRVLVSTVAFSYMLLGLNATTETLILRIVTNQGLFPKQKDTMLRTLLGHQNTLNFLNKEIFTVDTDASLQFWQEQHLDTIDLIKEDIVHFHLIERDARLHHLFIRMFSQGMRLHDSLFLAPREESLLRSEAETISTLLALSYESFMKDREALADLDRDVDEATVKKLANHYMATYHDLELIALRMGQLRLRLYSRNLPICFDDAQPLLLPPELPLLEVLQK
ncbi:MAG: hypothetical protein H6502_00925 [Candidatus Woesearchaeota archaeon]|nr:MAG: hypothetical protein H6502_00925 [Candidatus Woesearchaeota archaeon]